MKNSKKIFSALLMVIMLIQLFTVAVIANNEPLYTPQVGIMKLAVSEDNTIIVGLRTDGTINVSAQELDGFNVGISPELRSSLLSLTNIVDIACTENKVVALRSDGTVYVGQNEGDGFFMNLQGFDDAAAWTDIVSIRCGKNHLVGLKSDGTVVTAGDNALGQCNVLGWSNVAKIYASGNATLGLKKDGTVIGAGIINNYNDLRNLTNVKDLFLGENEDYYAIMQDGTITYTVEKIPLLNGEFYTYSKDTPFVNFDANLVSASLDEFWKIAGKTTDISYVCGVGYYGFDLYIDLVDSNNDMYRIYPEDVGVYYNKIIEKVASDVVFAVNTRAAKGKTGTMTGYFALDKNGKIWSDMIALTDNNWILNTNIPKPGISGADVNQFPPVRPQMGVMKVDAVKDGSVMVGLRSDGTINAKGHFIEYTDFAPSMEQRNALLSLTNVVDVACNYDIIAALKSDGTVYVAERILPSHIPVYDFAPVQSWTDIVSIDCGIDHLVALKADGTVLAMGNNNYSQCDVNWTNISKIYAKSYATIGIKRDGTVVATGSVSNYDELSKRKNVIDVYTQTGSEYYTLSNNGDTDYLIRSVATLDGKYYDASKLTDIEKNQMGFVYSPMYLHELWKLRGLGTHIVDIVNIDDCVFMVLDSNNTLYQVNQPTNKVNIYPEFKLIAENAVFVTNPGDNASSSWWAVDWNGQIYSHSNSVTSADWVLTTNITFNGKKINADVAPYVKDGRTLAPMRAILEALGMTVTWDDATQTATAVSGDTTISVTIGNNIAKVNGADKILDVPAQVTNGRTFVPVRFFAEALNMKVDWDALTKTVIISK